MTYIVTFPKSGTTWLQYIVALIEQKKFNHLSEAIPDGVKTHQRISVLPKEDKKIYLMRNPVDVFHSWNSQNNIDTDVALDKYNTKTHMMTAWDKHIEDAINHPDNVLFLSYEGLHNNFDASLDAIAKHLEVKLTKKRKTEIKKLTSFDAMKENSEALTPKTPNPKTFFRTGAANVYDNEYFLEKYAPLLPLYNKYQDYRKVVKNEG